MNINCTYWGSSLDRSLAFIAEVYKWNKVKESVWKISQKQTPQQLRSWKVESRINFSLSIFVKRLHHSKLSSLLRNIWLTGFSVFYKLSNFIPPNRKRKGPNLPTLTTITSGHRALVIQQIRDKLAAVTKTHDLASGCQLPLWGTDW